MINMLSLSGLLVDETFALKVTSSHFLPCRWTNVHNFLKTPSHFIMRLVRLLDRWNLSTCGICHNITFQLQGRLVLALILVQLQKGDSVAASKVSLTKLCKEQMSRPLSLINVSGLAAVGRLLWWRTGSGCKLFGPGEIWTLACQRCLSSSVYPWARLKLFVSRALEIRTGRLHSRELPVLLLELLTMTMLR